MKTEDTHWLDRSLDLQREVDTLKAQSKIQVEANASMALKLHLSERACEELVSAIDGLSDILHNHYGDDSDETPLIDKAFEVLEKYKK